MNSQRCNGRGAIACPRPHSALDDFVNIGVVPPCPVCKGIKEIQCPACQGRPMYSFEQDRIGSTAQNSEIDKAGNLSGSRTSEKRNQGGSRYQVLLAIHYFLKSAGSESSNTKKADFASFLTGFSKNTLRQQWSNIHARGGEDGVAWEKT